MSKTLLMLGGGLLGCVGLAALAMSMHGGSSSPADTLLSPPPPDSHTPPANRAAALQHEAARTPGLERRWTDDNKRAAANPRLRLPELLDRLVTLGFQPRIAFTWRSLATQDDLLAKRRTTVSFSFHNAVQDGVPAALAADLYDARHGWGDDVHGSPKTTGALAFFQALGAAARDLGLTWGGSWMGRPSFWSRYGIGWDPAHVQAVDNVALAAIREATLPQILGPGRLVRGSGAYLYRQFGNGYLQVVDGPALKGQLLMPHGNATAWMAITRELGTVA